MNPLLHKAPAGDRTTTSVGKEEKIRKERKDRKEDKERGPPYRSGMEPLEVLIRPWLSVMSGDQGVDSEWGGRMRIGRMGMGVVN